MKLCVVMDLPEALSPRRRMCPLSRTNSSLSYSQKLRNPSLCIFQRFIGFLPSHLSVVIGRIMSVHLPTAGQSAKMPSSSSKSIQSRMYAASS